jgi:hypothetical protein
VTITNGYTDTPTLADALGVTDLDDDVKFDAAINAASRQIDGHCGRGDGLGFWQTTLQTRKFRADDGQCIQVADISTATGLIVKLDEGDDGSFSRTLTINTDFILAPLNAALNTPVEPWYELILVSGYRFPMSASGRPGVSITAQFGWPAVPDDVSLACLIHAKNLYKAGSGSLAGYQLTVDGDVAYQPGMDAPTKRLLERFVKGLT